jgi:hypothetical protein
MIDQLLNLFVISMLVVVPLLQTYLLILCIEDRDWFGVLLYGSLLGAMTWFYPELIVDHLAEF